MRLNIKNPWHIAALLVLGGVLLGPATVHAGGMSAPLIAELAATAHAATESAAWNSDECCVPGTITTRSCEFERLCANSPIRDEALALNAAGELQHFGLYRSLWLTLPVSRAPPPDRPSPSLRGIGPSLAILYCSFQT